MNTKLYVVLLSLSDRSATKRVSIFPAAQLSCAFPQSSLISKEASEVPEWRDCNHSKHVVLTWHSNLERTFTPQTSSLHHTHICQEAIFNPPSHLHQPHALSPHHQISLKPGTQPLSTQRSVQPLRQDRLHHSAAPSSCPSRFRHLNQVCLGVLALTASSADW